MNFTNEELRTLRDLVSRIIFQFDFEHQDQNYQDLYNKLDTKLFNTIMGISEKSFIIRCLDTYATDSSHGLIWLEDKNSAIKYKSKQEAEDALYWFSKNLGPLYSLSIEAL